MNELIAKTVVKNKYWVVKQKQSGKTVATIQAVENGGFVYVHDDYRESYPSVKTLSNKYNIQFIPAEKKVKNTETNEVYGFPAKGRIYNAMYDIRHQMALYTKTPKSRSHYCAGWYLVKAHEKWSKVLCPKTIVINRYPYFGPYKTEEQMIRKLATL